MVSKVRIHEVLQNRYVHHEQAIYKPSQLSNSESIEVHIGSENEHIQK